MSKSRIIDWQVVEKFIAERGPVAVDAGILNDWFFTAATVYENGKWMDRGQAYVESSWAMPGFKATMPNGDVIEVACSREMTDDDERISRERQAQNREKALAIIAESLASKETAQ